MTEQAAGTNLNTTEGGTGDQTTPEQTSLLSGGEEGTQPAPPVEDTGGEKTGESTEPKWMSQLPDNLKENKNLTQYKTIGDLAGKLLDLERAQDGAIKIPGEDASDEERAAFREAIGVPKTKNDYDVGDLDVPESIPLDQDKLLAKAHELNISDAQLRGIANALFEDVQAAEEQAATEEVKTYEEIVAGLKSEWGANFDANLALVRETTKKLDAIAGMEGKFIEYLDKTGDGNDPMWVNVIFALGQAISEDQALGSLSTTKGKMQRDSFNRPMLDFPSME